MASRTLLIVSSVIVLCLTLFAHIINSEPNTNPFCSINNLKGCCKKGQRVKGLHHLKTYLAKFGYLEGNVVSKYGDVGDEVFDQQLESAIKTYQLNYRLRVSGYLDNDTVAQMMKPRCGFPDIINGTNTMTRYKSRKSIYEGSLYAFEGSQWPPWQKQLTYRFLANTTVAGGDNMLGVVTDALEKWAQVSQFLFEPATEGSQANLVFAFYKGNHGDGSPFDGPGGVLAHSFQPIDGNSHYDADEKWSETPGPNEIDLPSVVLHEIGHLLGLAHTADQSAVMFASLNFGQKTRDLQPDDIDGIYTLYGTG